MWYHVVWQISTNGLQELTASISEQNWGSWVRTATK